ncbi:hypothetical protein [Kitasatospora sp. NPDC127116]|uniref:hypothetical protein n=1 Tax=Kitasatospora sp. NPDC127116 TaxID=3345367 RepID=UPI00363D6AA0
MPQVHNSTPVPRYTWWGNLPSHLRTTTQLAALDLPRQPAGPVRATIAARNPGTGKKGEWDLYDVRESAPTAATGPQLAAAAARRTTSRACTECGARPESPCVSADNRRLCDACAHVQRLRERQEKLDQKAREAAEEAARLLADERLIVLHLDYTPGEHTAAGTPRPSAAVHITAIDTNDTTLYDRTVRLTGPRTPGAPAHAVDPTGTVETLAGLLADRTVVLWEHSDLGPLHDALRRLKVTATPVVESRNVRTVCYAASAWRADLDPVTGHLRTPTSPGRADRLLYLLRRMAGTATH